MRIAKAYRLNWTLPTWLALFLICAGGLFHQLASRRFLCGVDGYYYALQADTWALTGEVKIPDSSAVPRLMGLIQRMGVGTEVAVKALWAGLMFLTWLMFLFLVLKINPIMIRSFMLMWIMLSPSILFNAIEFPRMILAMSMVPLWFAVLRTRAGMPGALAMACGSILLHKGLAPFAVIFGVSLAFQRFAWRQGLIGFLIACGLMFASLGLKDHLRWTDWHRVNFVASPPGLSTLMNRSSLPISLKWELSFSIVVALLLLWRSIAGEGKQRIGFLGIGFLLPALMPSSPSEVFGAAERWALIYPAMLISVAAFVSGECSWKKTLGIRQRVFLIWMLAAAIALSAFKLLAYAHPLSLDPPYSKYEQLVQELSKQDIPLLVAHRGLNFYYKYRLRREAFAFEPEDFWDHQRIWRLTYRISPAEMNYYLPENCRFGSGMVQSTSVQEYLLIREDCWDAFRQAVSRIDDDDLRARVFNSWQNPSQKRPPFLYARHTQDKPDEFPALR